MVPMLTCGLVRSNFAFATGVLLWTSWFAVRWSIDAPTDPVDLGLAAGSLRPADTAQGLFPGRFRDDFLRHVLRNLGVGVELHRVARPALGLRPQVADVAEHF